MPEEILPATQEPASPPVEGETATIGSLAHLATLAARVGAGLFGVTALGYFMGYYSAEAYLSVFGATWAVALLSPPQILAYSRGFLLGVTGGVLSFTTLVARGVVPGSVVPKVATWLFVAAPLLGLALLLSSHLLSPTQLRLAAFGSALLWITAIVALIVELVVKLRDSSHAWKGGHLWLLYLLAIWGLGQAPANVAIASARISSDSLLSTLPHVALDYNTSVDWRLLSPVGDRLLLVDLRGGDKRFALRLVDAPDGTVRGLPP